MPAAIETARREAIAAYDLGSGPRMIDLDGLVQVAAALCGVSTAVVNIIDDRQQHQIAAVGFEPAVCSREDSMCAVTLDDPKLRVIHDAREDARWATNPFVTGEIGNVRFYASSPLVTPEGVTIGTLCVFDEDVHDLTVEQRLALDTLADQVVDALELRRLSRELQSSNEQLERFAAQVSHDLRNPLAAIAGFVELAADSPELADAPQAAAALGRAEAAAERMSALIGDLLSFAKLGGAQPRREPVDLGELVEAVREDLQGEIAGTGAEIAVDADIDLIGDPTLLRAMLQNLVGNAIKFTWADGRAPRIAVSAETMPGALRLTIDDNGPGVPVEQRERVFELMERGTTEEPTGLGIGLSTCRRIVDAHGGTIGIDEAPTGGARSWVVLPR
ncbi:MAG: ATP-binding protein [Microbacteriaceae bacterium]